MLKELSISVKALIAVGLLAFIKLCLSVTSVMLASVSARCEGSLAKLTLEWSLSGVHPFMNLKVRLVEELLATDALSAFRKSVVNKRNL